MTNGQVEEQDRNSYRRRRLIGMLTFIFVSIAVLFLLYWLVIGRFYETTDDSYVGGNMVQLMPQISGTVVNILADDTQLVLAGQTVVQLDPANMYINLQGSIANLARVVRQTRQLFDNVSELEAKVAIDRTNMMRLQADYERRRSLISSRAVSQEEFQHARDIFSASQEQLKLSQHQLNAARALVMNSDLYHHPNVVTAEAQLRNAYLNYQRTAVLAPITGHIAKRSVQIGQQVNPSTVLLVIVPLRQVWVDANFKESQLKHIRINQPVSIVSDFYGSSVKFRGSVVGLSAGTGSAFALLPPQNATGNWIKIVQRLPVRVALDAKQLQEYPLFIGLSMTATVNTHDRSGKVLSRVAEEKPIYTTDVYYRQLGQINSLIQKIVTENASNISLKMSNTKEES